MTMHQTSVSHAESVRIFDEKDDDHTVSLPRAVSPCKASETRRRAASCGGSTSRPVSLAPHTVATTHHLLPVTPGDAARKQQQGSERGPESTAGGRAHTQPSATGLC